jgi:hypothetical protein
MKQSLTRFLGLLAFLIICSSFAYSWDYTETFSLSSLTTAYLNSSFNGDNGYIWNYTGSRDVSTYGINGKGLMFRSKDATYSPVLFSNTISGGITDFTCSLKKAFTGSGSRQVALYINGIFIANSNPFDDLFVHSFEVKDLNIPGNVVIELKNLGKQITIDDLSWTIYGKPGTGTPTRVSIVKLFPEKPMANVPFKAVVQLIDDNSQAQKLPDNTNITLSLREGTSSLSGVLSGIIPAGQTTIVFDNLIYNKSEKIRLRSGAPDNKFGSSVFLRDLEIPVNVSITPVLTFNVFKYGHAGASHPAMLALALDDHGLPNKDFNGFKATIEIAGGAFTSAALTASFDNGVASFNNFVFSDIGAYSVSISADYIGSVNNLPVNVIGMPLMTDIIIPAYIKGDGSFLPQGNGRIPAFAFVKFSNLHPGLEYRYLVGSAELVPSTKPVTPGTMIGYNPNTDKFNYISTKDLIIANSYSSFTASASGDAYVWMGQVATSNSEYNAGKDISWCVDLGNSTGSLVSRLYTTSKSRCLTLNTLCNTNPQSMLYSSGIFDPKSPAAPKNYIVLYDKNNIPVSSAMVQTSGTNIQTPGFEHQAPWFYAKYEITDGAFATIIPNNLPGGVLRIAEYDKTGKTVQEWNDPDADGIWAGYNTTNCGYGINPPDGYNPQTKIVPFQIPSFNLLFPANFEEICNTGDPYNIYWLSRGIEKINIYVSYNSGPWEILASDYDSRLSMMDWNIPRDRLVDGQIRLKFEMPVYTYYNFVSNSFRIFDKPIVVSNSPSTIYCVGSDVALQVAAEGSMLTYQWYKDGIKINDLDNISGTNQPVLRISKIQHYQAGTYYALVNGHPNCPDTRTKNIAVYPARSISFILPVDNIKLGEVVGGDALLIFKVHINGVDVDHANLDQYDIQIQWYKVGTSQDILLNDDNRFAGTKSDWFSISKFAKSDEGNYYALVTGLCGEKVKSPIFTLVETDIKFSRQPEPQVICEGYPTVISGLAITSSKENIIYQWYKNGSIIVDNAIYFGTNRNALTITSPTKDAQGDYLLQASLETTGIVVNSNIAALTINTAPIITMEPEASINAITGRPLEIEIAAEANSITEKLTYQWYLNEKAIAVANSPKYSKASAQTEDAGTYRCEITNDCGTTKSTYAFVTVTTTTISDVTEVTNNGYSLSAVQPNPVMGNSEFTYTLPETENIVLTINDVLGNQIAILTNGIQNAGVNSISIDAERLNLVNGTYFYTLQTSKVSLTQRMVVIK